MFIPGKECVHAVAIAYTTISQYRAPNVCIDSIYLLACLSVCVCVCVNFYQRGILDYTGKQHAPAHHKHSASSIISVYPAAVQADEIKYRKVAEAITLTYCVCANFSAG